MSKRIYSIVLLAIMALSVIIVSYTASPAYAQGQAPRGPWVDQITFVVADADKAADMLINNEIQAYFDDLPAEVYDRIRGNPDIWSVMAYGLYDELTFNPVGPIFPGTGELNPFAVERIREAMNWLIDREYIANEIWRGLAVPRYTCLSPAFPDAVRYSDVLEQIRQAYSYDFDKAKPVIFEEMQKPLQRTVSFFP